MKERIDEAFRGWAQRHTDGQISESHRIAFTAGFLISEGQHAEFLTKLKAELKAITDLISGVE